MLAKPVWIIFLLGLFGLSSSCKDMSDLVNEGTKNKAVKKKKARKKEAIPGLKEALQILRDHKEFPQESKELILAIVFC